MLKFLKLFFKKEKQQDQLIFHKNEIIDQNVSVKHEEEFSSAEVIFAEPKTEPKIKLLKKTINLLKQL